MGGNVGGIKDVIKDQVTGFLFDPDAVENLGRMLVDFHQDRQRMLQMATAAREDALGRFSIHAVAEAHVAMYQQVLQSS